MAASPSHSVADYNKILSNATANLARDHGIEVVIVLENPTEAENTEITARIQRHRNEGKAVLLAWLVGPTTNKEGQKAVSVEPVPGQVVASIESGTCQVSPTVKADSTVSIPDAPKDSVMEVMKPSLENISVHLKRTVSNEDEKQEMKRQAPATSQSSSTTGVELFSTFSGTGISSIKSSGSIWGTGISVMGRNDAAIPGTLGSPVTFFPFKITSDAGMITYDMGSGKAEVAIQPGGTSVYSVDGTTLTVTITRSDDTINKVTVTLSSCDKVNALVVGQTVNGILLIDGIS